MQIVFQMSFKIEVASAFNSSYGSSLCYPKSIEPSPPLAQLRVRRSQFRESFFSLIYNKKFVVCYCFDLIGTPASEAEAHY